MSEVAPSMARAGAARRLRRAAALAFAHLAALCLPQAAHAEDYPSRAVRLVVGFAPGGGADLVGRMAATLLSDRLGRQVVVDNRGGAGGTLAAEAVANAPPDGYTLLLVTLGNALHPHVYKLAYDPAKAFQPVALLGRGGYVLCVPASLPAHSVKELVALAKETPGQLFMGNSGAGSFVHLASVLFTTMAGADIIYVAYKGSGPALIDVLGGQSQVMIGAPIQTLPHIKSGKLRALGVTDSRRSSLLPDVPAIAEAGVPGYEAANWWGIVAPAGTPRPVVDKLHAGIVAVLASDRAKKQFAAEGAEVAPMGPEELGRFMAAETVKWGEVVKAAGVRAE